LELHLRKAAVVVLAVLVRVLVLVLVQAVLVLQAVRRQGLVVRQGPAGQLVVRPAVPVALTAVHQLPEARVLRIAPPRQSGN